jgi:hypothetical protein
VLVPVVALLLVAACSTTTAGSSSGSEPTAHISASDGRALDEMNGLPHEWNQAAALLVAAYIDPKVSTEDFGAVADAQVPKLESLFADMVRVEGKFDDTALSRAFAPIVGNYHEKLEAVEHLRAAVASGDKQSVSDAEAELQTATADGKRLACALPQSLGEYMTDDEVAQLRSVCQA